MKIIVLISSLFLLIFTSCSSIVLEPADFAWPVESVIKVNDDGVVSDDRYSISFNVKNLFLAETNDSSAYLDKDIRIIRDTKGFYYITSNNFKNVYLFSINEGTLRLSEKILISEAGISKPVFNQREPYIELVEGNKSYYLSNEGIKENE